MRRFLLAAAAALFSVSCGGAAPAPAPPRQHSELWGRSGEAWTPYGRLPDFSFAGYRFGDEPLPELPVRATVKEHGASGDGEADDTEAFRKALASVSDGTVLVPAGRYRITGVLRLSRSRVVLRGEGSERTTLVFPKSLSEMLGPSPEWAGRGGTAAGRWSWGGGVLWCEGKDEGRKLADVTEGARRGDRKLRLSTTRGIVAGSVVRLLMREASDGSLGRHLHADAADAGAGLIRDHEGRLVDWASRVAEVSNEGVTLERPLRQDVRPEWHPEIFGSAPTLQDIGLENFSIEFPGTPYEGHFTEKGFNGIFFDGVQHSWVRDVRIVDADNGILFHRTGKPLEISRFVTLSGVRLAKRRRDRAVNGHHGIALEGPQDCLIRDFEIDTTFVHDLTVDSVACGNAFSRGRGTNLCFDHHTYAPFENLFTEIDAGKGDRFWKSGGPADGGPGSAARETFWNVRAAAPPSLIPPHPQLTIGGMTAWPTLKAEPLWIEAIPPDALEPANRHDAQVARRRSNAPAR